jgi:hypothetical protein
MRTATVRLRVANLTREMAAQRESLDRNRYEAYEVLKAKDVEEFARHFGGHEQLRSPPLLSEGRIRSAERFCGNSGVLRWVAAGCLSPAGQMLRGGKSSGAHRGGTYCYRAQRDAATAKAAEICSEVCDLCSTLAKDQCSEDKSVCRR